MPLARIEVEQVEGQRWVAEVEAGGLPGGPNFKREHFTADSFEAIMARVAEAFRVSQVLKPPKPAAPVEVRWAEPVVIPAGPLPSPREELFAEAEALGIDPDRRWGEARLQREIAAHKGDE